MLWNFLIQCPTCQRPPVALQDLGNFARPQAQERLTATLDIDPPPAKEPAVLPEAAKQALHSGEVFSSNIPKRH
jgi:hypothetical protein